MFSVQTILTGLAAALALLWLLAHHRFPRTFTGRCVRVCDGDTIWVKCGFWGRRRKLRLIGMDAPETEQPYGPESQKHLARLALDRKVSVTAIGFDPYGRWISRVRAGRTDLSLAMIRAGLAWPYFHYFRNLTKAEQEAYRSAWEAARSARKGLWADRKPEPPWNWRRRHRSLLRRFVLWLLRLLHLHR